MAYRVSIITTIYRSLEKLELTLHGPSTVCPILYIIHESQFPLNLVDTTVPSVGQVNITHTNIVEGILDPLLSDIRSVLRFHTTSGGRLSAVKSTVFLNGAMAEWPYLHSYLRRDENILGKEVIVLANENESMQFSQKGTRTILICV